MKAESLFQFLDDFLDIGTFEDYDQAINGLQVEGRASIRRVAAAVDASQETILRAAEAGADLLLVHHGLFWGGSAPITGPRFRKLKALLDAGIALYSAHLPLDAHPEVGNCAVLARELEIPVEGPFGQFKGRDMGVWGLVEGTVADLVRNTEEVVGGPVRAIIRGADSEAVRAGRVAVVTGAATSLLPEAASAGIDTLLTGEAPHHAYHDARELGVNLLLAGHYATETWGVRALGAVLAERFDLDWIFLDLPTGF
jgi:dinuclear metal center YbgI/SA1388 family protein